MADIFALGALPVAQQTRTELTSKRGLNGEQVTGYA